MASAPRAVLEDHDERCIGLILFDDDPVGEPTMHRLLDRIAGVSLHSSRLPFPAGEDAASLDRFAAQIEAAAAGILPSEMPAAFAFSCTTAAAALGHDRLARLVARRGSPVPLVTPIDAAVAAFAALEVERIAVLTPYGPSLNALIRGALEAAGLEISRFASFELSDADIPRASPASIAAAAEGLIGDGAQALFVSCTGLRATEVIDAIEARTGLPVVTSLQAMAWAALRAVGCTPAPGPGRLFRLP